MKHFALIFRATRPFTPEENKTRPADIAAWVKHVTEMGIHLDPRNFAETDANFSKQGNEIVSHEGPIDPTLSTIVYFDAAGKEQAVEIARIHPGLNYGVTVEVREWSTPRATPPNP
ncbi:MAG TPA: hypothetical protein VF865_15990 [Acidobacteriaceae bacterium]